MINDLVADLLTRIRNAQRAGHKSVLVKSSALSKSVLRVLREEGFIDGYEAKRVASESGKPKVTFEQVSVNLKYFSDGVPAISSARRVSKSGRRVYRAIDKMKRVHSGLGIVVLSTSKGLMSDREARKQKIGGEIIAEIY